MKSKSIRLFLALAVSLCLSNFAAAQQPFANVQQAPTTSPYLNLLQRGNTGLPAYQSLVKPQLQQQQDFAKQQQQIQHLARQQNKLTSGGGLTQAARGVSTDIRQTGHITTNMDYLHYYQRPQASARPQ
jgi:hypothetical protein